MHLQLTTSLKEKDLMSIADEKQMHDIASKFVGVRWKADMGKFEIQKQVKGRRDRKFTSDPSKIQSLMDTLVSELSVKADAIPLSGVPKVNHYKNKKPEVLSNGKIVWTIKQAEANALREYDK